MRWLDPRALRVLGGIAVVIHLLMTGCAVLVPSSDGPVLFGLGSHREVALRKGTCDWIRCPGLFLRLLPDHWGLSFGHFDLRIFRPEGDPSGGPVAHHRSCWGVDLGNEGLQLGASQRLTIRGASDAHLIQEFVYHEDRLQETIAWRQEIH